MTLAIVLLVAGLVVGGGIGYYAAPTKPGTTTQTVTQTLVYQAPLKGAVIQLGSIAASDTNLELEKPWHDKTITTDMNAYAQALGYQVSFKWLVDNAGGADNTHLEKVQGYHSLGVSCFMGGGWSSQASASLSYVNTNDMLMWSYSSTSPTLAIENDRLYRMCPSDSFLTPALVSAMWAYGIKDVIILQRGDSWGDGIVNLFTPAWTAKGGQFAGDKIRYDTAATEFSTYLTQAEAEAKTAVAAFPQDGRVGMLFLAFDEGAVMNSEMPNFPTVYDHVVPFGGDGTADGVRIMTDAPTQANHWMGSGGSLMAQSPDNTKYIALGPIYQNVTGQAFTSYSAYQYDIGFTFENTMLQAQSSQADDINNLQIPFCNQQFGASGWTNLLSNGDRAPPPFNIWIYAPGPTGQPSWGKICGSVDAVTLNVTFDPSTAQERIPPLGP